MLVSIDLFNLATLSLALVFVDPLFLYVCCGLILMVLVQAMKRTKEMVENTRRVKWIVLFPFLHIIRSYSFTLGRIVGGIRQGIISV